MFHRCCLCDQKRGPGVGKTKRGKGRRVMAITGARGLPTAIDSHSATQHEVELVNQTLDARFINERPEKLIADQAYDYDSDPLDHSLP